MKMPFTMAELTPEDREYLESVSACAVWDFVDTLPPDERAPFDAALYAPSGADFMREYGDRLREYLARHPEPELDRDWVEELNRLAAATDTEAAKEHAEKLDLLKRRYLAQGDLEGYWSAVKLEDEAYLKSHRGELLPLQKALLERRAREDAQPRHDPLIITAKHKATKSARTNQGRTDRNLTEALARIAELEAEVAKLTEERDAARKAYLDLLDQIGKGGSK